MTIITIKDYYLIIKLFDNEDYYLIIGNREDYTEGDRLCPPFRLYQKSGYHRPPFVKNYNLLVIEKETLFQLLATSRTHVPRYTIVENRPVLFPLAESSSMQRAPVVEGVVEAWTFTRAEKSETAGIAGNTWHWRIGPTSSHRKSQRKKERKRERERDWFSRILARCGETRACVCKRRRRPLDSPRFNRDRAPSSWPADHRVTKPLSTRIYWVCVGKQKRLPDEMEGFVIAAESANFFTDEHSRENWFILSSLLSLFSFDFSGPGLSKSTKIHRYYSIL